MGLFDFFKKKSDDLSKELSDYNHNESNYDNTNFTETTKYNKKYNKLSEKELIAKVIEEIYNETKTDFSKFELVETSPSIFESKIGGIGYVPHNEKIPTDCMENQLKLLAQIDCSEILNKDFPEKGLLQFWFLNDIMYGCNIASYTKQDTFRVIYYADIDYSVTKEEVEAKMIPNKFDEDEENCYIPFYDEYGISFSNGCDSMTFYDYRFDEIFCKKYNAFNPPKTIRSFFEFDTDILENIEIYNSTEDMAFSHKIGGYPGFAQEDPREDGSHDFLLLQLDSDYDDEYDKMIWCNETGIANFFIDRDKLKNLDFSDVLYIWDCCD